MIQYVIYSCSIQTLTRRWNSESQTIHDELEDDGSYHNHCPSPHSTCHHEPQCRFLMLCTDIDEGIKNLNHKRSQPLSTSPSHWTTILIDADDPRIRQAPYPSFFTPTLHRGHISCLQYAYLLHSLSPSLNMIQLRLPFNISLC
jgi:hypothetical protein